MPHTYRSFGRTRRAFSAHFREYIDLFLHSLWTVICPPLFFDWQEFHIKSQGKLPLAKCWTKSTKMFYLFNGLFYVEHMIFCVPIILFKVHLDQRNKEHEKYFPLLPQVIHISFIMSFIRDSVKIGLEMSPKISKYV